MRIISHRGNVDGPGSQCELVNVESAFAAGFDVEVDVRLLNNTLYVGHDAPIYPLPDAWFQPNLIDRIWFHAKDIDAHRVMLGLGVKTFMHDDEPWVMVGDLKWHHPRLNPTLSFQNDDIALDVVGFPRLNPASRGMYAVCTDWPLAWRMTL